MAMPPGPSSSTYAATHRATPLAEEVLAETERHRDLELPAQLGGQVEYVGL